MFDISSEIIFRQRQRRMGVTRERKEVRSISLLKKEKTFDSRLPTLGSHLIIIINTSKCHLLYVCYNKEFLVRLSHHSFLYLIPYRLSHTNHIVTRRNCLRVVQLVHCRSRILFLLLSSYKPDL